MNQPSFSIVDGKTIREILLADIPRVIRAVEDAYRAHHAGRTVNPDSYFLRFPDNPSARIIALPAHIAGVQDAASPPNDASDASSSAGNPASSSDAGAGGLSGIKWIASYPSNLELGIPRASAVLILNDARTGYPFACLESSIISAARTAASAASGVLQLYGNDGRREIPTLGVIGAGLIARFTVQFLLGAGFAVNRLVLYDRNADYAAAFQKRMESDFDLRVEQLAGHDALVSASDVALLTTTAAEPYLSNLDAFSHNPLVLNISLRDVGADVILASHNVVDDVDHCCKAQTSPHLAEQLVGNRDFITSTLPAILSGDAAPPPRDRPVVFSPFGMGILDLAVGGLAFAEAQARGRLTIVPDFFYEMTRA